MRLVKAYWNWLKYSVNAHGIHSPFLFLMYNEVVRPKKKFSTNTKAEQIRKSLLKNQNHFENIDLGAGSKKNKGDKIQISQIAKHALKPKKQAQLIARLVQFIQPKKIIELGTSFGISTLYMADAAPHAEIHTIEGNPHIRNIAVQNFKETGYVNIISHEGDFDELLPKLITNKEFDLWFIDGNHTYEATLRYFEMAMNSKKDNLCILFDDIYWSEGMQKAWEEICAKPDVSLSLDLFHLGIIFKKSALTKEHYYIR